MNRLAVLVALFAVLTLGSCNKTDNTYQGWIEANLIFVGPDEVGRVQTLSVREGDVVKSGQPLFTVDDDLQQADLAQVKASLANAQQTFDRAQQLAKTGSGTQKDLDAAIMLLRDAQARLNSAQTRLARRQVFSPVTGTVQEVYTGPAKSCRLVGRSSHCCRPAISKCGSSCPSRCCRPSDYGIKVSCDSCSPDITAHISFIARQSEFTPPVIYSLEERSKLVFLVEALPGKPDALRVGQPVDVTLTAQSNRPSSPPEASR